MQSLRNRQMPIFLFRGAWAAGEDFHGDTYHPSAVVVAIRIAGVTARVETTTKTPLTVFLPGLGADASLAPFHPVCDGDSLWLDWPDPIPADWEEFTRQMKRQIPVDRPIRLVGISFGGLVAQECAHRGEPTWSVFLVGSLTDRSELRLLFRFLLRMVRWIPVPLFDLRWLPAPLVRHFFGITQASHLDLFQTMAARLPARSVRNLCLLAAAWQARPLGTVDRIHGRFDRILRARGDKIHYLEGGHLLSMTHPEGVNAWLEQRLRRT